MERSSSASTPSPRSSRSSPESKSRRKARAVDDGDHRVQPGQLAQLGAKLVRQGEGGRDGKRLGDTGRFDQQVVEATFPRQPRNLVEQVFTQRAADAAVGHLDQPLVDAAELGAAVANELGIDVDLAHVVDDDRDAAAFAVVQRVVEQRRLAGAEEAGEHGYGKA